MALGLVSQLAIHPTEKAGGRKNRLRTSAMGADESSISDMSMYWQSVVGIADMAYCCSAARLSCGHPCLSTVCGRTRPTNLVKVWTPGYVRNLRCSAWK